MLGTGRNVRQMGKLRPRGGTADEGEPVPRVNKPFLWSRHPRPPTPVLRFPASLLCPSSCGGARELCCVDHVASSDFTAGLL